MNNTINSRIRIDILNAIHKSGASHIASAFSIVEILISIYNNLNTELVMSKNPNRDVVILSKGHAGISLYATLKNYGMMAEKVFETYYKNGSKLSGHISHEDVAGIEFSTGSLGYGLGVACGISYAKNLNNNTGKVFCILGDGECNEGSIWESALFASHHKLNNLIVIIDHNSLQGTGYTKNIIDQNLTKQFSSFGWHVVELDGHNIESLENAYKLIGNEKKPLCIVAKTTKGKGVTFMEANNKYHYKDPQGEEYLSAISELSK